MNRSLTNVILGGFGTKSTGTGEAMKVTGTHTEIDAAHAAGLLTAAKRIIIVPGYGLAVARAQYAVADMVKKLRENGVTVKFGIHPVAGECPSSAHSRVPVASAAGFGLDQQAWMPLWPLQGACLGSCTCCWRRRCRHCAG